MLLVCPPDDNIVALGTVPISHPVLDGRPVRLFPAPIDLDLFAYATLNKHSRRSFPAAWERHFVMNHFHTRACPRGTPVKCAPRNA